MENILPVLDMNILQEKTNQYAMAGALKSIEEYYVGWNSPFRKAIEDELKDKKIGTGLQLPDIIGLINVTLSKEIDIIANNAVAQTFVPDVKRFLTREKSEMMFSEILKEIIDLSTEKKYNDYEINITEEKELKYGWLNVTLCVGEEEFKLTLHLNYDSKKEEKKRYQILSLPRHDNNYGKEVMKIKGENVTLELPFVPGILNNPITSFFARLIICQTKITMDCTDFDESMFPEEECHCND